MMPALITSTRVVSEGRPPMRSATPGEIGVVTLLGRATSAIRGCRPAARAMPQGRQRRGQRAGDERDQ